MTVFEKNENKVGKKMNFSFLFFSYLDFSFEFTNHVICIRCIFIGLNCFVEKKFHRFI